MTEKTKSNIEDKEYTYFAGGDEIEIISNKDKFISEGYNKGFADGKKEIKALISEEEIEKIIETAKWNYEHYGEYTKMPEWTGNVVRYIAKEIKEYVEGK